jgi:hypothetical protein
MLAYLSPPLPILFLSFEKRYTIANETRGKSRTSLLFLSARERRTGLFASGVDAGSSNGVQRERAGSVADVPLVHNHRILAFDPHPRCFLEARDRALAADDEARDRS